MTTNNASAARSTHCAVCDYKLTRATRSTENADLCDICWEQAGLENDHMDGNHDDAPNDNCPDCGAGIGRTGQGGPRKGHSNTAAHTRGSHAECYAKKAHDKTPAARAACRKARNA